MSPYLFSLHAKHMKMAVLEQRKIELKIGSRYVNNLIATTRFSRFVVVGTTGAPTEDFIYII